MSSVELLALVWTLVAAAWAALTVLWIIVLVARVRRR